MGSSFNISYQFFSFLDCSFGYCLKEQEKATTAMVERAITKWRALQKKDVACWKSKI